MGFCTTTAASHTGPPPPHPHAAAGCAQYHIGGSPRHMAPLRAQVLPGYAAAQSAAVVWAPVSSVAPGVLAQPTSHWK
jgi:hypothetical protein